MVPLSLPDDHNNDNASSTQQLEMTLSVITRMESTLYRAAAEGKIDAIEEHGHLDQLLTPNRNTVLHIHITAAKLDEETEFVQEILKICPPLLLQTNVKGETPLHLAARYGHARIVKLLIEEAKTDHEDLERFRQMLRMTNKEKDTALHEAVRFGHRKVVSILTKEDPDFSYSGNEAGETPLYMAAERGYDGILAEILDNCSSPATSGPNSRTVLHALSIAKSKKIIGEVLNKFKDLTKQEDDYGRIPLHYAAELNCEDVVKLLLKHDKFTAYIKDKDGMTALHIAASQSHHKVMKEIISLCPDCCELVDKRGWNVLHFAVQSRTLNAFRFMNAFRFKNAVRVIVDDYSLSNLINEKDVDGNTPFLLNATSFTYSSYLANCPRVDKDAFNKENQNALDIVSRSNEVYADKYHRERKFRSKGIRSNRRIARIDTQNSAGEYDDELMSYFQKRSQAQLVAATVIATVTFAGGFELRGDSDKGPQKWYAIPLNMTAFAAGFELRGDSDKGPQKGYAIPINMTAFAACFELRGDSDKGPQKGYAIPINMTAFAACFERTLRSDNNRAFMAFMITDTIAMVLSIAAVVSNLYAVSVRDKSRKVFLTLFSARLTMLSMGAMVIAFFCGTSEVDAPSTLLATATVFSGLSFIIFFYIVLRKVYSN